jgi:RNA polymerase sigma-70 factor, ECF subfamily
VTPGADPSQGQRDSECVTLGDILYAGTTKEPASEREWVDLVRSIATGDQLALHALYTSMHRIVFTLALRVTGDRATADELTVDVFYDVWRRAAAYDPAGGSVIGWIMNQTRSRAIDRLRFEQRKKRVPSPLDDTVPAAVTPGPREALDAKEQRRLVRDALEALAPEERQAIETAFFSQLSYREAAERLKQPLGTVKTRIRSGLEKLRHALATPGQRK